MKKFLTAILVAAALFTTVGCSGRPATTADVLQSSADAEEGSSHDSQGSLRTGLYAVGSLSSSASAGEEDGLIQTDVTIVAVTVDETGVITDCVIDAVQAKANFDSQGQLLTDLTVPVPSKNELGADYGMGSISGIGKEWNEQAQALADYVVGKTADEVLGIAVDEATKPAEADLASSVTISIGGFQNAIAEAVDRAQPLGAQAGDELRLVTSNSMAAGNAPEGAAGMVETNVNIAAVTMNGDAITSCVIDAVQAQVSFDGQGQLLTDLSAPVPSKNDRGADYGMGAVSSIGKEWNEQAAAFAAYVTGKTLDEVAGIAVDEATKPAEADLASRVTISIGGFQALLERLRLLSLLLPCLLLTACAAPEEVETRPKQYQATFLDVFDTVTTVMGYAESQEVFTETAEMAHDLLLEYHQLYDIYNDYEGIHNLKTVNDQAGIAPVTVDARILDLLLLCRDLYADSGGKVNAAMGSVLLLWHEAREASVNDPEHAYLPEEDAIQAALEHTSFDNVVLDEAASTVYLTDPAQRLDVGAVAKGYAAGAVAAALPTGMVLSLGGNVCVTGPKPDGSPWVIGVQNPDGDDTEYVQRLDITSGAVVTSGDYQRYYTVDGVAYHHIIDPDTGWPARHYRSVTVICADSGLADALSTAAFIMDEESGRILLETYGAEALWVYADGSASWTGGCDAYFHS